VYSAAPECFLMGLFSLLDSLVGRPLSELLPELGLRVEICRALLGQVGEDDQFKRVLDLCIACEAVNIRKIRAQAECMALPSEWLAELCIEAMNWVEVASQSLGYPD